MRQIHIRTDSYLNCVTQSTFEQTVQLTAMCYKNQHTSCFYAISCVHKERNAYENIFVFFSKGNSHIAFLYKKKKKRERSRIDRRCNFICRWAANKIICFYLRVLYFTSYISARILCPVGRQLFENLHCIASHFYNETHCRKQYRLIFIKRCSGGGGDFRPVIHYRDLDAPREPDEFL